MISNVDPAQRPLTQAEDAEHANLYRAVWHMPRLRNGSDLTTEDLQGMRWMYRDQFSTWRDR